MYSGTLVVEGLRRGDVRSIDFNLLSIPFLLVLIPVSYVFWGNIFSLVVFLVLPSIFSIYGIPRLLRVIEEEELNKRIFRIIVTVLVSYAFLLVLWFFFAFSFNLVISIFPQLLQALISLMGFDYSFASIIFLFLVLFLLSLVIFAIIIDNVSCKYGLNLTRIRIVLYSLFLPAYVLIMITNAFLEFALYLLSREFFTYVYVMIRSRFKNFYNDFFYVDSGRCRKRISEFFVDWDEKYKEVSGKYWGWIELKLKVRVGKGPLKREVKPIFAERFNKLMGMYKKGFKTIKEAENFSREYYLLMFEGDKITDFVKRYVLAILIWSPIFLILSVTFKPILSTLSLYHYLMIISSSTIYLTEILLYKKINLKNLKRERYPLLFNQVINNIMRSTAIAVLITAVLILFYSILTIGIIGIMYFLALTVIVIMGYNEKKKAEKNFLTFKVSVFPILMFN